MVVTIIMCQLIVICQLLFAVIKTVIAYSDNNSLLVILFNSEWHYYWSDQTLYFYKCWCKTLFLFCPICYHHVKVRQTLSISPEPRPNIILLGRVCSWQGSQAGLCLTTFRNTYMSHSIFVRWPHCTDHTDKGVLMEKSKNAMDIKMDIKMKLWNYGN